jgi:hypothetical protein
MTGSCLFPRREDETRRVAAFLRRLDQPVPAPEKAPDIPAPVGVIGAMTLLIGALVMLLVLLPQSLLDRSLTAGIGGVLIAIGWLMKRSVPR